MCRVLMLTFLLQAADFTLGCLFSADVAHATSFGDLICFVSDSLLYPPT